MTLAAIHLRTRPRPRAAQCAGFTLLELLVSLVMVAILAVSLYASLKIGFRAKASAEAQLDPARSVELAMGLITTDLQSSPAPNGLLAGAFIGTSASDERGHDNDDLNFFTLADSPQHGDGNGEIKNIELNVVQITSGDHVLVRKVVRNLLAQQTMPPDVEVISRGVSQFNLRYFNGTDWTDDWDSTQQDNTLPVAVELTLTMDTPPAQANSNIAPVVAKTYVRIIPLPCSTAATDAEVNPNASGQQ